MRRHDVIGKHVKLPNNPTELEFPDVTLNRNPTMPGDEKVAIREDVHDRNRKLILELTLASILGIPLKRPGTLGVVPEVPIACRASQSAAKTVVQTAGIGRRALLVQLSLVPVFDVCILVDQYRENVSTISANIVTKTSRSD